MNVCLLTWWGDSLTYTVVRALTENGHAVDIFLTDRERHHGAKWGNSARIREIPGVRVHFEASAVEARHFDLLIIQSYRGISAHTPVIRELAIRAGRITLITFGDLARPWREALGIQFSEWRVARTFRHKLERVAYKDSPHALDVYALMRIPRTNIGFDVHSKFLHDDALFRQIHARDWDVRACRPLCLNFVGSRDPKRRGEAVDQIDRYLDTSGARSRHSARIMWKAYTDDQPEALPESEFVKILSGSDFTLAPPGYSLVTHRPIEAMLRGSIPILNEREADIYKLGLRDGENCLLVRRDDWGAAVARALDASQTDIERMREGILAARDPHLDYSVLSAAICGRIGAAN